jgi:hypothetical protein
MTPEQLFHLIGLATCAAVILPAALLGLIQVCRNDY